MANPRSLDDLATVVATILAMLVATNGVALSGSEVGGRLTDLDRLVEEMKRRGLMQLFGRFAAGSKLASPALGGLHLLSDLNLDPDEQERVVKAIVSPDRVDEHVIRYIETVLWACQRQEDTFGPRVVLSAVLGQTAFVHDVLLPACPDRLLPRMLALHSSLCGSAGWYYFDMNNFELAWRQFERARKSAHEARDTELSIYALCNMSGTASWHGQAHTGLDLAAVAQAMVAKTGDSILPVCVADKMAMSYAADGKYDECMKALDDAQRLLSASAGQVPPGSLAYYYTDGLLANHKSLSMLRLGKQREAVASGRTGLALYDRSFARDFAFCILRLGNALVQSKEIDEAVTVMGEAAELATQTRSTRLVKELHIVRAAMRPWQDMRAVRELDEQLVGLGLVPGCRFGGVDYNVM